MSLALVLTPHGSLTLRREGELAKGVMDRVCREGDGLFPAPGEIKLSCSCPDWADMCKHVAAVLYGVGARLDQTPQLLFVLRGVDENELLAGADTNLSLGTPVHSKATMLDDTDVAALFGLEMADDANSDGSLPAASKPSRPTTTKRSKSYAPKKPPTEPAGNSGRRKPAEVKLARDALAGARKRARRQPQHPL
jgi:uncharacterized Zn finger protein